MQLDIDVRDRRVSVVGTLTAAHRAIRRHHTAGARVTAVLDGPPPATADRLAGVRYRECPPDSRTEDWVDLLGSCWLVVLVGVDEATAQSVRAAGERLRVAVAVEPPAAPGGLVTLVGGGPGALGLLTLEACAALREADVVCYDRLAPTDDLARLAPAAELVDVGKQPQHHAVSQGDIQALLVARARAGQSVVRLKGGDPFVFGRGGEELQACLEAGVAVRVVPGVSSALAVPAAVGVPLTQRGVSRAFTVVSAHDPLEDHELTALAGLGGTVVLLMGVATAPQVSAGLVRCGMPGGTPALVVERGFSRTQRTTRATVGTLADEIRRLDVRSPAVIVLGEVVAWAVAAGAGVPGGAGVDAGAGVWAGLLDVLPAWGAGTGP